MILQGGGDESLAVPDIFMVQKTWAGKYEAYTRSAPSSILTADTVKTAYYPVVAEDFARDDVVRGLPLWIDSLAVIYNKKILATAAASAPPTTWADFKNLALTLTKRSNNQITQAGFAGGKASNVSFAPEMLSLLLMQNGVSILDQSGNPIFSIDSDSVTALDFYQSFAKSSGTWDDDLKNDSLAFLEGDVGMIVAPSWRLYDILKFNDIYDLD
jgi:ABC-type glycerol-3-phosphate transport system substrate-binding protein